MNITDECNRLDLSASQLARLLGVSPTSVDNWRKGRHRPDGGALLHLTTDGKTVRVTSMTATMQPAPEGAPHATLPPLMGAA